MNVTQIIAPSGHLATKRDVLTKRRERLLASFTDATTRQQPSRMRRNYHELTHVTDFLGSLDAIQRDAETAEATGGRRFMVSSLFLDRCFRELTADEKEQFFFITGSEVGGVSVLDQKIEFEHQRRSVVGVTGDMAATHELLIHLEQFGHRLLAHFHSHPGLGPMSTRPSGVDKKFQGRLERAGYPAVAGIFSRDGYVRFFRLDDDFELEMHGTGVEQHDHHVYRLTHVDQGDRDHDSRRGRPATAARGL